MDYQYVFIDWLLFYVITMFMFLKLNAKFNWIDCMYFLCFCQFNLFFSFLTLFYRIILACIDRKTDTHANCVWACLLFPASNLKKTKVHYCIWLHEFLCFPKKCQCFDLLIMSLMYQFLLICIEINKLLRASLTL